MLSLNLRSGLQLNIMSNLGKYHFAMGDAAISVRVTHDVDAPLWSSHQQAIGGEVFGAYDGRCAVGGGYCVGVGRVIEVLLLPV